MTDARPFRFGVNLLDIGDRAAWREKCRKAECLGYDVILVPDHIGFPAPFPALVAAGEGTTRPRLGTFVLNAGFYNPTLLARDVAATDQLTEGRLELGLGAGYVKAEFDTAGLPFGTGGERLAHLRATVERLRELLEDPEHRPAAAQARVPLLLGGNGDRMLRLAARHAEIVGFTGAVDDGVGNLSLIPPDALAERVAFAREAAGDRADEIEWNVLVQTVELTDDPDAAIARWCEQVPYLDADQLRALPTALFGSPEQIAAELVAHRERYGFSYVTVLDASMEAFAEVIALVRGSS